MDSFCGGRGLWSIGAKTEDRHADPTWTDPVDVSTCFEDMVIEIVPAGFVLLAGIIRIALIYRRQGPPNPRSSSIYLCKQLFTAVSGLLMFAYMIHNIWSDQPYYSVVSPGVVVGGTLMALVVLTIEHNRGVRSSGVLALYWLLVVLASIVRTRTVVLKYKHDIRDTFRMGIELAYFGTSLITFGFTAVREPPFYTPLDGRDNPCPEETATLFSIITFWWMTPMMITGFKRPLTNDDLWDLNTDDQAGVLQQTFKGHWAKQMEKDKPSVTGALWHSFGGLFVVASLFKLVQDLLGFVSPQLLKYLIRFIQNEDDPKWHGYAIATLMLVTALIQSIFLHQYFGLAMKTGMRLRSALICSIYEKAMRLSNSARQGTTAGEIVNLMSVDSQRFMDILTYLAMTWSAPLQIALSLYFLYEQLGNATLAGLGVMLLMIPLNGVLAKRTRTLQQTQMKTKDERLKSMNELLNGIKIIKLYGWETPFRNMVQKIRDAELDVLKRNLYLNAVGTLSWVMAPFLVSIASFITYTVGMGMPLTAEKAFVSLSLFNLLRFPLAMLPMLIAALVQASVAEKRLAKFLSAKETNPNNVQIVPTPHNYGPSGDSGSNGNSKSEAVMSIENGTFAWTEVDEDGNPARAVLRDINLHVGPRSLTAIVGEVGCGKSSLVSALLGDMEKRSGTVRRPGSVAYVPQTAWIRNATVRDNILFGKDYNKKKFDEVVDACALRPDLELLDAGEMTEIGEKGINLSGGQKQRISLARAVYQDAYVYIFDDPLSAVDSHVGKHIFEHVIGPGGLLRDKVRVLVTHGIHYLPSCDQVVVLKNGTISECGHYDELITNNGAFAGFIAEHSNEPSAAGEDEDGEAGAAAAAGDDPDALKRQLSKQKSIKDDDAEAKAGTGGALIAAETAAEGGVKWPIYRAYIRAVSPFLAILLIILYILSYGAQIGSNFWLTYWSNESEKDPDGTQHRLDKYLGVYGAFGIANSIFALISGFVLANGSIRASTIMHDTLIGRVIRAPMSFFDTTPLGRVVNRFSKDIYTLDETIPQSMNSFLRCLFQVISILVVIAISTPIFMAAVLPMGLIYYFVQRFYVATSRQLKRIESVSRSPIYTHFSETLGGVSSIRAYQRVEPFIEENEGRVNYNLAAYYPSICSNRWLALRLEFVGNCIVFFAALFAVLERGHIAAGVVGLSLSYAMSVTQTLNWLVRMSSQLETDIVAVERVDEYSQLDQEAEPFNPNNRPNDSWPEHGQVDFNDYQLRYRPGLDLVLRGIDCHIKSGEKIGIVGRTGAGKSSLTLALFRIIEPAGGRIVIDGQDITRLGLQDLRSRLTIMPQEAVLFSAPLRFNLDPLGKASDEELWSALETSHLKPYVKTLDKGLDSMVSEGGDNFSAGQRQLICLARALLRHTKILLLDEATASVDLSTDNLIQQTIRKEFADCTILTIAHRINTIMDSDRVMVLDKGRIVEFASPQELLENRKSVFFGMAKAAGIAR